jgi:hypothetical protein
MTSQNVTVVYYFQARLFSCVECSKAPDGHNRFKGGIEQITSYKEFHFELSNRSILHELMVPTCTYRMGVQSMGYAAAVIGEKWTML